MRRTLGAIGLFSLLLTAIPAAGLAADDSGKSEAAQQSDDSPIDWSLNARLRPRFEVRSNHRFGLAESELNYAGKPDEADIFTNQARLGAGVKRGAVSGTLLLQHATLLGTTGGDELTDPDLRIHLANLKYQPAALWYLQAGRMQLAYGDHRVLGTVGWSQVGRAWDGVRTGLIPLDGIEFDLFGARYNEGSVEPSGTFGGSIFEDDAFLTGLYASATNENLPLLDAIDAYALYDVRLDDPGSERPNHRNLLTFGGRIHVDESPVDGTLEGALQTGSRCVPDANGDCTSQTNDIDAWFFDSELGASFEVPALVRIFAGFGMASGDDPDTGTIEAYNHLYPTAHKFLGYTDIIGPRSNVQEIRGGLSLALEDPSIKVAETAHHFMRLQPAYESVGLEFDTTISVGLTDGLAIGVGHGLFVPNDGISSTDSNPSGLANWLFAQIVAKFPPQGVESGE